MRVTLRRTVDEHTADVMLNQDQSARCMLRSSTG